MIQEYDRVLKKKQKKNAIVHTKKKVKMKEDANEYLMILTLPPIVRQTNLWSGQDLEVSPDYFSRRLSPRRPSSFVSLSF